VLREMDSAHMVLLRFVVAALAAAPFALRGPEVRALFRSPVVLLAGVLYGIAFMVQFEGLAHVSVTVAALLVGAMPALIAVSGQAAGREGLAPRGRGGGGDPGRRPDRRQAGRGQLAAGRGPVAGRAVHLPGLAARAAPRAEGSERHGHPGGVDHRRRLHGAADRLRHARPAEAGPQPPVWSGVVGQGVLATLLATAAWQFGSARVGAPAPGCSSISSR
jgi:hypothetical protein